MKNGIFVSRKIFQLVCGNYLIEVLLATRRRAVVELFVKIAQRDHKESSGHLWRIKGSMKQSFSLSYFGV